MLENIGSIFENPAFLYGLNLLNASAPSTQPKSFGGVLGEAGINTIPMLQQAQTQRLLNQLRTYQVQQAQSQQEQTKRRTQFMEDLGAGKWTKPAVPAQPSMLPDVQSVLGPVNSLEPQPIMSHPGMLPAQSASVDRMGMLGAYLGAGYNPEGLDELMKYTGIGPKRITHAPAGSAIIDENGKIIANVPAAAEKETPEVKTIQRLMELRDTFPAGSAQWNLYDSALKKHTAREPAAQINFPAEGGWGVDPANPEAGVRRFAVGKNGEIRWSNVKQAPSQSIVSTESGIFTRGEDGSLKPLLNPATGEQLRPASVLSQDRTDRRQIVTQLEKAVAPHLQIMNSYRAFQEARGSGDNSQANQILASELLQMARSGNQRFKGEAEKILGTEFAGGSLPERIANFTSQLASGRRTAGLDAKVGALADALAGAAASRVGDEIKSARGKAAAAGISPDSITGPRVFGNIVVWPDGSVRKMKDAAEMQRALDAYGAAHGTQ